MACEMQRNEEACCAINDTLTCKQDVGGSIRPASGSRILRLARLAPEIVVATLGGWADQRVVLGRQELTASVAADPSA